MFDTNITSCGLGLTVDEQTKIKAAMKLLPCGWDVALETTDSHDVYARVIPPWNANVSAFLIDRERHGVILTDNISKDARPMISIVCDIRDATDYVVAVVSGGASRAKLTAE